MSESETAPFNAPVLVDPSGKPARKAADTRCPQCGAGKNKRVASCGFGIAHPVCSGCGYEWHNEEWHG